VLHAQPVAALTEVVVVTATRTSKPLASVSAAIDVITREDIERSQASSLADVLRNAMGMELARNGGPGTVTSFFLRGHNSVNLVVLVDGIRTPTDGIGSLLALDIPVSRIERIEVLRGDASALYGGAANGGVVHIITRKVHGPYAQIGAGSRDRRTLQTGVSRTVGDTDVSLHVGRDHSARISAMNVVQKPAANSDQDQSLLENFSFDLGHRLSEHHKLSLSLSRVQSRVSYDDDEFGFGSSSDTHNFYRKTDVAQWMLTSTLSQNWRSELALSGSRQEMQDRKNGILKTADYSFGLANSQQHGLRWVNHFTVSPYARLMVGADMTREQFKTDARLSGYRFNKEDQGIFAGLGSEIDRLGVQINLRRDHLTERNLLLQTVAKDSQTSALLGLSYRLRPGWSLTANASTGFRAPSVGEQAFSASRLRNESFFNREVGVIYRQSLRSVRLSYFKVEMREMIAYDRDFNLVNLPALNEGFELSARTPLGSGHLSANLTLQDPENRNTGKQLARRAKRVASMRLAQPIGESEWWAGMNYQSQRRDSDFNERVLRPYATVDLGVSYALNRQSRIRVMLENATNRAYQTAYGYNAAGRGIFATVTFEDR
jgi:vitamin B12 transporter